MLWESIPELDKQQDAAVSNNELHAYQDSLRPSFDRLRHKIRDYSDIRDPLKVRTQYDEVLTVTLGQQLLPQGDLEQRGVDAFTQAPLLAPKQFYAPTGRFTEQDIGKTLRIRGSANPVNNRDFVVAAKLTPNILTTVPEMAAPDAGPLRWELRTTVAPPADHITVEVRSGDLGEINLGWVISDGVSDFEVVGRRRFNDQTGFLLSPVKDDGTDLYLLSYGPSPLQTVVRALSGAFTQEDVGKPFIIRGSTLWENNTLLRIKRVISATDLELDGQLTLPDPDSGRLLWELRQLPSYGQIDLLGLAIPRGVVEQENTDLIVLAPNTVQSPKGNFSTADVGKRLSITGTAVVDNAGTYKVLGYIDPLTVVIDPPIPFAEPLSGQLRWELRQGTRFGDLTRLQARAPTLITLLGNDFGVTVDTQESEARQRSFVRNIHQWIELKGTEEGYWVTGAISGFDVTTQALYRISMDWLSLMPLGTVLEVGEITTGRYGVQGKLVVGTLGVVRFESQEAAFKPSDEGVQLRIWNTAAGPNSKLYSIDRYIDAHTVEFRVVDVAPGGLPDYGIAGTALAPTVKWRLVRLYTTLPPSMPVYDEINSDAMVVASPGFGVDRFCWEAGFTAQGDITIMAVTPIMPGRWLIHAKAKLGAPDAANGGVLGAVAYLGTWKITDSIGQTFYLETVPNKVVIGPPAEFEFETVVGNTPALGDGVLKYNCPIQPLCSYCPASKIWVMLTAGTISTETGVAIERILDRVLQRLIDEVKPAHVDLIVTYRTGLSSFVSMGGYDASLYTGSLRLSSPTARFLPEHGGRRIRVSNTSYPSNSREYRIKYPDGYISQNEVQFELDETATLPEPMSGHLIWQLMMGAFIEANQPVPHYLRAPFTAHYDEQDADVYRGDTAVVATIETNVTPGGYVPSTFGTATAGSYTFGG